MALRRPQDLGVVDPRTISAAATTPAAVETPPAPQEAIAAPVERDAPARRRAPRRRTSQRATGPARAPKPATGGEVALRDQLPEFVQILAPGELHDQLLHACMDLRDLQPRLAHQKTVIGALLWRYVDHDDQERLAELGVLLNAWEQDPLSQTPATTKIGVHVPAALKRRLDRSALIMRRTHGRRLASAKAIISALVWRHSTTGALPDLEQLLISYHDALRPAPPTHSSGAGTAGPSGPQALATQHA